MTVVRYTELRPFVVRLNDTGGGVDALLPAARRRGAAPGVAAGDAAVGGGAGPDGR